MRALLIAAAILVGASLVAAAQGAADVGLDQVEREMDAHRYAEARQVLGRWWAAAGDTVGGEPRAHGLFLRAVLAEDLGAAEQDLLRVAVEHPQSRYADRALFRLAQARIARADSVGAAAFLDRLLRDHPGSSHRAQAAQLLGRREAPAPHAAAPPARTPSPPAPAPQRPDASAALPSEVQGATFTVEVGSFQRVADAEAMRERLRQAGFDAFLARVGGDGNTRVRIGAYRERPAAQALQQRLRAAGYAGEVMTISGR